jgi:hypothetical protein
MTNGLTSMTNGADEDAVPDFAITQPTAPHAFSQPNVLDAAAPSYRPATGAASPAPSAASQGSSYAPPPAQPVAQPVAQPAASYAQAAPAYSQPQPTYTQPSTQATGSLAQSDPFASYQQPPTHAGYQHSQSVPSGNGLVAENNNTLDKVSSFLGRAADATASFLAQEPMEAATPSHQSQYSSNTVDYGQAGSNPSAFPPTQPQAAYPAPGGMTDVDLHSPAQPTGLGGFNNGYGVQPVSSPFGQESAVPPTVDVSGLACL